MKYPALLTFSDVLPQLDQFDAIIDVRSPSEFAEDHLPGAINCPVLNDVERIQVGTLYKQVNSFEAKKVGAAIVSKNIAQHIDTVFMDKPRDWKPLIYCWRGGNRSGSLAHIMAKIGWPAVQLDGGYKAYRKHVNSALVELPSSFTFQVICGTTGSGKSRLLQTLEMQGDQVLDLEHLAAHRGSVLGNLPAQSQPSQKLFESRVWQKLRSFDTNRIIYIESESKKVGNLRVPDALIETMRASACISLTLTASNRIKLLVEDYAHFIENPSILNTQLDCLVAVHGCVKIDHWKNLALSGQMEQLVNELLTDHYDPAYKRSIHRNFINFPQATMLLLRDITEDAFHEAAEQLRLRLKNPQLTQ